MVFLLSQYLSRVCDGRHTLAMMTTDYQYWEVARDQTRIIYGGQMAQYWLKYCILITGSASR